MASRVKNLDEILREKRAQRLEDPAHVGGEGGDREELRAKRPRTDDTREDHMDDEEELLRQRSLMSAHTSHQQRRTSVELEEGEIAVASNDDACAPTTTNTTISNNNDSGAINAPAAAIDVHITAADSPNIEDRSQASPAADIASVDNDKPVVVGDSPSHTPSTTPPLPSDGNNNDDNADACNGAVNGEPEVEIYYPALSGCRNVSLFDRLNKIEEGTYGVVFRAKDRTSGEVVALKKLKMEKEREGFPITSIREVDALLKVRHENIVWVHEIVVGASMDDIYMVMEYVEHDMKTLLETMRLPFLESEVKTLLLQLLRGVQYLHENWILHRDLKTSNLLLSHQGVLKIADFGMAREYGSPLKEYTNLVVTQWYRGPELFLGERMYSTSLDMWSVGCIFSEFLTRKPLFPGKTEVEMLKRIFKLLGTPDNSQWEGYSDLPVVKKYNFQMTPNRLRVEYATIMTDIGKEMLQRLLCYDPKKRISAADALAHKYFTSSPLPTPREFFPTYPAKSELAKIPRRRRDNSNGDPEADDGLYSVTESSLSPGVFGPAGFTLKF